METAFCECRKCDAPIGRFANLWTQIGKSYFSPVVEPEDDLAVQCQGSVRVGEPDTLVEECHLQDIVCANCGALLGLKCVQTPVNHVLDQNQLLLRLASIDLLDSTGQEIEFAIKRVLSVAEPSRVTRTHRPDPSQGAGFSSAFPEPAELEKLRADLHSQREDIRRIDNNGFRIVSALDKRASRIEVEITKLKGKADSSHGAIGNLQQDIGSMKADIAAVRASVQDPTALASLEARLASVTCTLGEVAQHFTSLKEEIDELKSELSGQRRAMEGLESETRAKVTAARHAEDMASLRAEIMHLRRQVEESGSKETGQVEAAFPSRELEVLTSNIAKIGSRASQVETLQMELEILKGRVERVEASRQPAADRRQSRIADPGGLSASSDLLVGTRKRTASPVLEPVTKRPSSSVGCSDFLDRKYATPPVWPVDTETGAPQEHTPDNEGLPRMANPAKERVKSLRSRTISTANGSSTRPRKR